MIRAESRTLWTVPRSRPGGSDPPTAAAYVEAVGCRRMLMEADGADQYLIEQIRRGSEPAWRQLIARYQGRLLAFARGQTASLADAEDLVQEVFVGFLQSLSRFDAARSLETYLFTILRHKLIDQLRRRRLPVISAAAIGDEGGWDQVLPGETETPSGIAVKAEGRRMQERVLRDALKAFIHGCRDRGDFDDLQVVELLFYAGKRNLEVADLFDIDQKAVAGVKFRAIQRLQKSVEQESPSGLAQMDAARAEVTVAHVWRKYRLTCLKRSTLGSYLLGILEDPWLSYTQFHLDVVGCPICLANLEDLQDEQTGAPKPLTDSILASSVGFLSRVSNEGQGGASVKDEG
ncbi:MAG: sigma-70 family RNA polymerase sigma factor [Phycisphaerales bacterium]|nr:MAG: sigma-70 family RNA polymerase sigma factor [Phycisphaerales bacterium]